MKNARDSIQLLLMKKVTYSSFTWKRTKTGRLKAICYNLSCLYVLQGTSLVLKPRSLRNEIRE